MKKSNILKFLQRLKLRIQNDDESRLQKVEKSREFSGFLVMEDEDRERQQREFLVVILQNVKND